MPQHLGGSARRVLAISGSTRSASTNTALCHAAATCAPPGVRVTVYEGLADLPHFNPDDDHEPLLPAVAELRDAIEGCDAVLFSVPEYAGALPGSMKNLLDWTVGATVMTGKAVAWVNVSPDPRRGAGALAELATVLGYVQAVVVTGACAHVPLACESIGVNGLVTDPVTRAAIADTISALLTARGSGSS